MPKYETESNDKRPTLSNGFIIASTAIQCVAMAIVEYIR